MLNLIPIPGFSALTSILFSQTVEYRIGFVGDVPAYERDGAVYAAPRTPESSFYCDNGFAGCHWYYSDERGCWVGNQNGSDFDLTTVQPAVPAPVLDPLWAAIIYSVRMGGSIVPAPGVSIEGLQARLIAMGFHAVAVGGDTASPSGYFASGASPQGDWDFMIHPCGFTPIPTSKCGCVAPCLCAEGKGIPDEP